jgi:drug/metabolite transporter (DMT)-like permease
VTRRSAFDIVRAMWILFAAVCSTLNAVSSAITKRIVERSPILASTFWIALIACPVFAIGLAIRGMPPLGHRFVPALLASVVLTLVAMPIRNLALRISPLSLTMPLLATTPVFLLATEALFLGNRPGPAGMAGVALIGIGAYALYLGQGVGLLGPWRALAAERGSQLMLVVAAVWSVTSILDKIAVTESSSWCYLSFYHLLYAAGSLPLLRFRRQPAPPTLRREWRLLVLAGLATAGTLLAQMAAIQLTLVSYVIAIKRSGMLLSVVFGGVFFGERNLGRRLLGTVLMAAGVGLILFGR